ncbi:MAG: hypothetical protein IPJ71_14460 [Bdellovibrionales bacterium]|nr:hypothetical protein [Bdellovibrionales bacterium]
MYIFRILLLTLAILLASFRSSAQNQNLEELSNSSVINQKNLSFKTCRENHRFSTNSQSSILRICLSSNNEFRDAINDFQIFTVVYVNGSVAEYTLSSFKVDQLNSHRFDSNVMKGILLNRVQSPGSDPGILVEGAVFLVFKKGQESSTTSPPIIVGRTPLDEPFFVPQ